MAPNNENAFNPCFLTHLLSIFGLISIVWGFFTYWILFNSRKYGYFSNQDLKSKQNIKVLLVLIEFILFAYVSSFITIHERFADQKLISFGVLSITLILIILPLHVLEPFYSPIQLDVLLIFWPCFTIFVSTLYFQDNYTQWVLVQNTNTFIELLLILNSINIFILEYYYYNPSSELIKDYKKRGEEIKLEEPNIIQRVTFTWMNDLIVNTYKNKTVTNAELPNSPDKITTLYASKILNSNWHGGSLLKSLLKSFGYGLSVSFWYEIIARALNFVKPQLLRLFILYFTVSNPPILKGLLICISIFANTVFQNTMNNKYMLRNLENSLNIRSSLTSLVYKKALHLSSEGKSAFNSGDIMNLMSVDVNRISYAMLSISAIFYTPFDVIVGLISLWPLLGTSTLAAFLAIALIVPINIVLVKYITKMNKEQMKLKDQRTNIINEILMTIKSIKLYAWEKPMLKKLSEARNDKELKNLKRVRLFNQISNFTWSLIPIMMNLLCFGCFVLTQKRPLTSDIVFPAITLLNLISSPILDLPDTIDSIIEGKVALDRVKKFLICSELDEDLISYGGNKAIEIKGASFYWKSEPYKDNQRELPHALKDINFEVNKGDLACVVGKVGSGKTSLLYAILGSMVTFGSDPLIKVNGSVAYCAQSPWIMNASVKENVLFGHRYDQEYYELVIRACQLEQDLRILPDGDETQVGEKGVSLSGGQKARLSLARAVYARADIYLLDDILSAVDSHVGRNIIEEVISKDGLLGDKTIILCTNSVSVLKYSDTITMLEDGQVKETTRYQEINEEHHPQLFNLITTFSKNEETSPINSNSSSSVIESKRRKASIETFNWDPLQKLLPNLKSGQTQETSQKGKVKWNVYVTYFKACSLPGIGLWIIVLLFSNCLSIGSNYWLKHWTEENSETGSNQNIWSFLFVYAALGIGATFMTISRQLIMKLWLGINASKKIHDEMALKVLGSPMEFFERTPVGRIMNRFTNDINRIDDNIPNTFAAFVAQIMRTFLTLIVVSIAIPAYSIVILILGVIYYYYETYYVAISRELKRLVSVSRSPIYGHLGESLNGIDTIRAYGQADRFEFIMSKIIDFNLKSQYMLTSINRWLFFRLQVIGGLAVLSASIMLISTTKTSQPLTSSMAGFLMTYALQVTGSLRIVVRQSAEVETSVVAVERCLEYTELKSEETSANKVIPPLNWPTKGEIKFINYSTKYRENLDLILKNINLSIKQNEKIGVVGRTGAGKSSLALSIFRIIEPVEGNVEIDNLNTSNITLFDLRHKLGIIPQDSQLFNGTIRQNLDPFNYYKDEEIWKALELAHLKDHIAKLGEEEDKLLCKIDEGGSNFSAGQRQLMSLARVLLKMSDSNILVLDEASSSIDLETDKILQQTIRSEFKNKTIVTIAHRIDTIMDSDKIIGLDQGELIEFDTPENLFKSQSGVFYGLCKQGGYL
ncbi:uncharacterized protein KGF55_003719 [Candida pseudojiufengensis]|uniref:uncharacterized protein n=1 Tax=Candida pseudojiufengensis TaxID=497109 RepID=UPI002224BA42|nr:uncharacterized protein KGF55_003719 [Candida pseudojiufengensis]KAI5962643.1 hypothetical protein KGF55_003719 [Candida pseudojiufengensis]